MHRGFSVRGLLVIVVASIAWVTGMTAAPALAHVLQLREGQFPTAGYDVEDTELRESGPDASFEVNPRWNMGNFGPREREAVAFPVSLPTVTGWAYNVTLDVWQSDSNSGHTRTVELHSITNANYVNESTATWNSANTGQLWTAPGGDFSSTILSSVTVTTTTVGTNYQFASSPALVSAVNAALAGDGIFRFMVKVSTAEEGSFGYVSFIASDNNGHPLGLRPLLTINYVPEPATAALLVVGAAALCMRRRSRRALFHCLILGLIAGTLAFSPSSASAAVATITDTDASTFGGTTGTASKSIFRDIDADYSNVVYDYIGSYGGGAGAGQTRRALMRFDVSSLAGQYTQINSIMLNLYPDVYDDGTVGSNTAWTNTLQVLQIDAANAGWNESNKQGSSAAAGDSSWLFKSHPSTAWAGGTGATDGLDVAGTDYNATPLATALFGAGTVVNNNTMPLGGGLTFAGSTAQLTALIDAWVNPATNGGLLLKALDETTGADTIMRLNSGEEADATLRPTLVINYTPVPEPTAALGLLAIGALSMMRRRK